MRLSGTGLQARQLESRSADRPSYVLDVLGFLILLFIRVKRVYGNKDRELLGR
jgi:hypothetical protein